jgi:shikimate dehydrogenase
VKKFGLLGEKLGHSFSPGIHKMLGEYNYELCEVAVNAFDGFMKGNGLDGFNVTIPYKQAVIHYCTELSDNALSIGSVNTVTKKQDGTYSGYNTDYDGFMLTMMTSGMDLRGKKALVLGSGGASKTVTAVLKDLQMGPVITVSRKGPVNYASLPDHRDAALIVNTTPVGMFPENGKAVVDLEIFSKCEFVTDLIYNPARTKLLLQAEKLGIKNSNGLLMLVEQARRAAEIFTGAEIQQSVSFDIKETIEKSMKNIIIIGMPGCGKTTVGRFLAGLTKRKFIDTDEAIENLTGQKIPDLFSNEGEIYFRSLETEVLANSCKQSGLVIAAGGGAVTIETNKDILRQNGSVIFLTRSLDDLTLEGRPLSIEKGVRRIYEERVSLYMAWSDLRVENNGPRAAANEIKEALHL